MKVLCFLLLMSVSGLSSAEECTTRAETVKETTVTVEACSAVVDDVVKADVDGYRFVAYIVKWKGQRVVATDISAESNLAVGDRLSFSVLRMPLGDASATDRKYLIVLAEGEAKPEAQK